MDKEYLVTLLNSSQSDSIVVQEVISWYLKDNNIEPQKAATFISLILSNPVFVMGNIAEHCYDFALKYYLNKFNIITLHNQKGQVLCYY